LGLFTDIFGKVVTSRIPSGFNQTDCLCPLDAILEKNNNLLGSAIRQKAEPSKKRYFCNVMNRKEYDSPH
jgi:hypothetical protein